MKSLSCVRLFATPWTAAYQAPPSMGFSRQESWSGVPLPSPYLILSGYLFGVPDSSVDKECLQCRRPQFDSWVRKICWRRDWLPTPVFLGFPCGSSGKESVCHGGDLGLIPRLGRSPGEGNGYPLQYSGWENSMDRIVQGVARDFHFTSHMFN